MRRLVIERLGHRGEGVARAEEGLVFVPFALPGETVLVEAEGEGELMKVVKGKETTTLHNRAIS